MNISLYQNIRGNRDEDIMMSSSRHPFDYEFQNTETLEKESCTKRNMVVSSNFYIKETIFKDKSHCILHTRTIIISVDASSHNFNTTFVNEYFLRNINLRSIFSNFFVRR